MTNTETYSRFFEVKEQSIRIGKELKDLQKRMRDEMEQHLELTGKTTMSIVSAKHGKVLQFSKGTARASLNEDLLKGALHEYITEIGTLTNEEVGAFMEFIDAARNAQKRDTTRLSYRSQKAPKSTAAQTSTVLLEGDANSGSGSGDMEGGDDLEPVRV